MLVATLTVATVTLIQALLAGIVILGTREPTG